MRQGRLLVQLGMLLQLLMGIIMILVMLLGLALLVLVLVLIGLLLVQLIKILWEWKVLVLLGLGTYCAAGN